MNVFSCQYAVECVSKICTFCCQLHLVYTFFDTKALWQSTSRCEPDWNNCVCSWLLILHLWCCQAWFLPSVCYLKDIGCCKVIISSQVCLNWQVLGIGWSVVFFRGPGIVADLMSVIWRSLLQRGNELGSLKSPAHHYLPYIDNGNKAVSPLKGNIRKCSICIRITYSLKCIFIRQTCFLSHLPIYVIVVSGLYFFFLSVC